MPTIVKKKLIIGSRSSKLAIKQSEQVIELLLKKTKKYDFEIKTIQTTGDKFLKEDISKIGGKGIFINEIEESLTNKSIDFAIHSMKDMPTFFSDEYVIAAVPKRLNPCDVFLSNKYSSINKLPANTLIGTSSARRKAILLQKAPDIKIINFRGNINTRIKKLMEEHVDGIILAYAGLKRLNLTKLITHKINFNYMLPAAGQGALAIECLTSNNEVRELLYGINDKKSQIETDCERIFLAHIEGSCHTPISAYAKIRGNKIKLEINITHPYGISNYYDFIEGNIKNYHNLALNLAEKAEFGAKNILRYIKSHG